MNPLILHLETSTKVCSVALSQNGILLSHLDQSSDGYIHGEVLTLMIQDVLQSAKVTLEQIHAISYSSGPGSYTGLRIGLSTAKGLCFALQIPLIAIPTHLALFELAKQNGLSSPTSVLALLDARRTEVYMQIFDSEGNSQEKVHCALLENTSITAFIPAFVVGDANEKAMTYWEQQNLTWINTKLSAQYQVLPALTAFENQTFEDLAYCSPIYLKGANGVLL